MDISNQCRPGLGKPWISPTGADQIIRIGISQTSKIKSGISLICAAQTWYIPKTEKIYLWSANMHSAYPWYSL